MMVFTPFVGALIALSLADLLARPAWWWAVVVIVSALAEALFAWLRIFWRSRQDHVYELEERVDELEDALVACAKDRRELDS